MIPFNDKDILNYLLAFKGDPKEKVIQEMNEKYKTYEEFTYFVLDNEKIKN